MGIAGLAFRSSSAEGNAAATTSSRSIRASSAAYFTLSDELGREMRISTAMFFFFDITEPAHFAVEGVNQSRLIAGKKADALQTRRPDLLRPYCQGKRSAEASNERTATVS